MRFLRIFSPALTTAGLTILCILLAKWLTGLLADGEWSELIKAAIIVFVVASALITVAWSAYLYHSKHYQEVGQCSSQLEVAIYLQQYQMTLYSFIHSTT